jgi:hypothetical protein
MTDRAGLGHMRRGSCPSQWQWRHSKSRFHVHQVAVRDLQMAAYFKHKRLALQIRKPGLGEVHTEQES